MQGFEPGSYGDAIADVYDDWHVAGSSHGGDRETDLTVNYLVSLAEQGPVLELGVGTGRVALPLAVRGVPVSGIEISQAMVARLRAKPGGVDLPVHVGDMADVDVPGEYSLIYVVASSLYGLISQAEQLRCLGNAAARLQPDGRLVIEAFTPDPARFVHGRSIGPSHVGADEVRLDVAMHDPVGQIVTGHQVHITTSGFRLVPIHLRYIWPSELDLMARLAGLDLVSRYSDWDGEPYGVRSRRHISTYANPPGTRAPEQDLERR